MKVPIYFLLFLILSSCKSDERPASGSQYMDLRGQTMGTTYHIHYNSAAGEIDQTVIDSILNDINSFVSTYESQSLITSINKNKLLVDSSQSGIFRLRGARNIHFEANFNKSYEVYRSTRGFFDPTVMPLVNYWGFGYDPKVAVSEIDTTRINDILTTMGMNKWKYRILQDSFELVKPLAGELDFSAIAKGYAVDFLASHLDALGIEDYMVEIGGEVFARGVNASGRTWAIGLNSPRENASYNDVELVISLSGQGLASSGNYRNFHVVEGRKYGHEINPVTGFPEISELLAVSVIAPNCMTADAYATAYMIMGLEQSIAHVESMGDMEACFFFGQTDGSIGHTFSSGFQPFIDSTFQSSKSESR